MRFSKEFLTEVGLYDVEIDEYFVFDENNYLVSITLDFDGMTRIIDFSKVTYLKTSGCGNNSSIVLYYFVDKQLVALTHILDSVSVGAQEKASHKHYRGGKRRERGKLENEADGYDVYTARYKENNSANE